MPSVSGGILWPDTANKIIYAYGGEQEGSGPVDAGLWYYDILYNTWNVSTPDGIANVNPAAWGEYRLLIPRFIIDYLRCWNDSSRQSIGLLLRRLAHKYFQVQQQCWVSA